MEKWWETRIGKEEGRHAGLGEVVGQGKRRNHREEKRERQREDREMAKSNGSGRQRTPCSTKRRIIGRGRRRNH